MTATAEAPPREDTGRSKPRALLITGATSYFGRRLARRLDGDPLFPRLVGIDYILPPQSEGRLEVFAFDILDPGLPEFLAAEKVEAVAHLLWLPEPLGIDAAFRVNVAGTAHLIAAAAKAGVRAIVFKSSTSVYGASPANPLYIPEGAEVDGTPEDRRSRHLLEAEGHFTAAAARYPEMATAVLRFAPILGVRTESRLAGYLRPSRLPTSLGYDPRVQVIHEDDAVEALAHALTTRFHGPVNVAAEGVLPLHRILRLLGRTAVPLPHPLLGPALALHAILAGHPHLRMDPEQLRFPPVGDLARMAGALGFKPARDALAAVLAVAGRLGGAHARADAAARHEAEAERERVKEALRLSVTGETHGT